MNGLSDWELIGYCKRLTAVGIIYRVSRNVRTIRWPGRLFFDALHSSRRCAMVEEAAQGLERVLVREMEQENVDYLAGFPELETYRVLAGDGHTIAHSSHAEKKSEWEVRAVKHNLFTRLANRVDGVFCCGVWERQ